MSTGTSKATYLADVLAGDGELFNKLYVPAPERYLYPLHKQCVQLVLISPTEGYLRKPLQDVIADMLSSVVEICPASQKGGYLRKTCDLPTSAVGVLMVHESSQLIESDIERIREAERNGELYVVFEEPLPESPKHSPKSPSVGSPMHSVEKVEELWAALAEIPETEVEMTGLEI